METVPHWPQRERYFVKQPNVHTPDHALHQIT